MLYIVRDSDIIKESIDRGVFIKNDTVIIRDDITIGELKPSDNHNIIPFAGDIEFNDENSELYVNPYNISDFDGSTHNIRFVRLFADDGYEILDPVFLHITPDCFEDNSALANRNFEAYITLSNEYFKGIDSQYNNDPLIIAIKKIINLLYNHINMGG